MPNELKPCPFCGGSAELHKLSKYQQFYVDCAMEKGDCAVIPKTWNYNTEKEAIEAWNRRVGNG